MIAVMTTDTLRHAATLWDYLAALRQRPASDAIVVCCSYDLRVADYACELYRAGIAPRLVFSGNTGNWTRHLWSEPEAHVFRERALAAGVLADAISIEVRSTNFGENIRFSRELLPDARRVLFVTKPNSVLRVALTIPIQWPGIEPTVDAPPLKFPDEVSNVVGILGVIEEMVGDVQRIMEYPALGYQAPHALPHEIETAWQALVAAGFTGHMLPSGK